MFLIFPYKWNLTVLGPIFSIFNFDICHIYISQTTFITRFLFSRFFVTSLSENIVVFILQKEQKVCIFFSTLLNKANLGLKKTFFWLHTSLTMSQYIGYMIDQENVWKYDEMLLFHFMLSPVKSWKKQYILRISTKECTFSYEWSWLW